ncbi:thiamine-phosphate pyrophosphorylase [Glycocaulis alkaliphilus]|uniref:Thiamine-phosphate synthase n=1 Tax=Glycocaulis alkaliphilus TaxID=1434191 RepID=A0A3T0ED19_9PROT|nr:thiamine phosphate synthase [Glycocaulis alkaliphilus]AZU05163.1 thiamine-phosphate pyrophosphorylase [Glycocaulis alkaliphilus]GGB64747.1 thiamine-phosphate synthase [Glycocaulis alkaliphilus]
MSNCQLYLLTPPRIDAGFAELLDSVLAEGVASVLQIRLKDQPENQLPGLIPPLVKAAKRHGVSVLMNDRPDLAVHYAMDGVHIGQEDAPYAEARAALGKTGIVGVTCHDSRHLAMTAAEKGADYVAFGAMFPTATKSPKASASVELIEWWSEVFEVPCVAIGGITPENASPVIEAGADFIAVSGGVWNHPAGPVEAVRAFGALLSAR